MLPIEEVAKWLVENRTDEIGDLDLMGLDFSDFDGDVLASGWKVKKGLAQSRQEVKDEPKCPDMCVGPDYKAEYERLRKELCEANTKIETLMWVLMKIKEEAK